MRARIRWREKKKKGERGRTGKQGTWEILESQKKTNLHEKERKLSPSKHSFSSFFFPYTYIFLRLSFYSAFFFLFLIISLRILSFPSLSLFILLSFFFLKKKKSHLSSAYVLRYSNYFENTASPFQEACDASCKELMIFTCSRGGHCSTKLLFFKRLVMHIAKS